MTDILDAFGEALPEQKIHASCLVCGEMCENAPRPTGMRVPVICEKGTSVIAQITLIEIDEMRKQSRLAPFCDKHAPEAVFKAVWQAVEDAGFEVVQKNREEPEAPPHDCSDFDGNLVRPSGF